MLRAGTSSRGPSMAPHQTWSRLEAPVVREEMGCSLPGCRDQWLLDSEERTRRGARRGQLGQVQGSRWRSPRPPSRRRATSHGFLLAEKLGTRRVRLVDLHASAGTSCFKLSKATPCGADGQEQVVLTAFLRPRGPESERSPPWPAVGLLRSLFLLRSRQRASD